MRKIKWHEPEIESMPANTENFVQIYTLGRGGMETILYYDPKEDCFWRSRDEQDYLSSPSWRQSINGLRDETPL